VDIAAGRSVAISWLFDEAQRRDPGHARDWVVLVDGDNHQIRPIEAEAAARGITGLTILIDLIHVAHRQHALGRSGCAKAANRAERGCPDGQASLDFMTLSYDTVFMETERRYTIAELADASAAALDALGIAARNGQVRDRPDVRTIRYYGALGLVDRPAEMTGRTALYGDQHLLQVLAVKALQARGATLADVQRTLVGASEPELRAAVGPGLPGALTAVAGAPPVRPDRPFWRTPPATAAAPAAGAGPLSASLPTAPEAAGSGSGIVAAEIAEAELADTGPCRTGPSDAGPSGITVLLEASPPSLARTARRARLADDAMRPRLLVAVPLAEGASLLIEHADGRAVDPGALRAAAAPLLAYLTDAGLLPGSPPTSPAPFTPGAAS
jgi:DNA-binding transcriptional MerR regulator